MANVTINKKFVWVVSAGYSDEKFSWTCSSEDEALRTKQIVENWRNARCPKCGMKKSINLDLSNWGVYTGFAQVWCAYVDECGFSQKIHGEL